MSQSEPPSPSPPASCRPPFESIAPGIQEARARFLELTEPHRPALFRYARGLAGSLWDAEDLVQDTLVRAFENLGRFAGGVRDPRAYLFRMATNLWIDRWRREPEPAAELSPGLAAEGREPLGPEVREALERLAVALPPRERAVVLLAEVFQYTAREIATALATTVEAAKAALHRGRAALLRARDEAPTPRQAGRRPPAELLDAFVAAFNARDIGRLLGMLDAGATIEIVGCYLDDGPEASRNVLRRTWEEDALREASVAEVEGEPCAVLSYAGDEGEAIGDLVRLWGQGRRVTRTRWYYYSPEVLAIVADALGRPVRGNGYRHIGK